MTTPVLIFLLTLFAGITIPLGALIARLENIRPCWLESELRHSILAFGGGTLLSSVALVLVPGGIKNLPPIEIIVSFGCGGLAFFLLDRYLGKSKLKASNLIAMMSDFVPEALALGAIFTASQSEGLLLSLLIALQNLPEGFNAFRELKMSNKFKPNTIVLQFLALAFLGPVCGLSGYYFLSEAPKVVGYLMLFSSGGILYIVFQDIAPQAKLEKSWGPPLGAVIGFLVGLIGHVFIT